MRNNLTTKNLSLCAQHVKIYDWDHFFCAFFAPEAKRETLMRLLAFNAEITRAVSLPTSWSIAGPMAGLIRLQWWRELIENRNNRDHEIAQPIRDAISSQELKPEDLLSLIDAREAELEGIEDWHQWRQIMMASSGKVQSLTAQIMGVTDPMLLQAVASLGAAYESIRLARYLPTILQSGRCPFPKTIIEKYHLIRGEDGIRISQEDTQSLRDILIQEVRYFLKQGTLATTLPKEAIVAILPIVFCKRDLKKSRCWDKMPVIRGIGDRLAVIYTAYKGSIASF